MIYLSPEIISGLGEDTFWTWFHREFPTSVFEVPKKLNDDDIVMRYSTLGFLPIQGKQVAICWELLPDMRERFDSAMWDKKIDSAIETARYSTYRTVASELAAPYYQKFGSVDVIPIGVDISVFRPMQDKISLRKKYNLPVDKKIVVWVGTSHPMKGYTLLLEYARKNPDKHFITICKTDAEAVLMPSASGFVHIPQQQSAELINAADFFLSTSLLKPFYMAEWEAMACDIPMVIIGESDKDFTPSAHPRNDVLRLGWDRPSVKNKWENFFRERGIRW